MRSGFTNALLVVGILAFGCGRGGRNTTSITIGGVEKAKGEKPPRIVHAEAQASPAAGQASVTAGKPVVVEGRFKIAEADTKVVPTFTTVKLARKNAEGKYVTYNEKSVMPEQLAPGEYSFKLELRAPYEPGDYEIRVNYRQALATAGRVTVQPSLTDIQ
jgi:hypothetical protein